jgi:RNA polymerase sigma-70 factor (ECF subfamily)
MTSGKHDLGSLLQEARAARPGAVAQLLEAFRNYLRLMAQTGIDASLRGKADPSDLVQECLLKAHQRFDQFRGQSEAELAGWLRQILARNLTDLARRFHAAGARQVSRERSLEDYLEKSSQVLGNLLPGNATTPSQAAQRRELSVVLADALADLSADYREVILLRSIQELGWEEVAGKMGRSPAAVRLLWARALKQLRPLIESRL